MIIKAAALLSLFGYVVAISSTESKTRELDLVTQIKYNEEPYTADHRIHITNNWEHSISDDGYTIVTTALDPDSANGTDKVVRVLKFKQSKWQHMRKWSQKGQDIKCDYTHSTVLSTDTVQYGKWTSLSGDGNMLAVTTGGTGSFGSQVDRYLIGYVDVYIYNQDTRLWDRHGRRLDGAEFGANAGDRFGAGVKLSTDGTGLFITTDCCYRKTSAGNNHDRRTDKARGFEWSESNQDWEVIFSIDQDNWNSEYGICSSKFAFIDILKSKDGTKWYYALSGYHHNYFGAYTYEENRITGVQRNLGPQFAYATYIQLFQSEDEDLRAVSYNNCHPGACGWGSGDNSKGAWTHHIWDNASLTWKTEQNFYGTVDRERFGTRLSLSANGHFVAARNNPDGLKNRVFEYNPTENKFEEIALTEGSDAYPILGGNMMTILGSGDVLTMKNEDGIERVTRYNLDPGVRVAGGGGDPHFIGFGGLFFTWQGHCDIILIKTPKFGSKQIDLEVHIRTRKIRNWSAIDTLAFKVGKDIGEIESNKGKLTLNGSKVDSFETDSFTITKSSVKEKIVMYEFIFDEDKILEVKVNTRSKMIFTSLRGMYPEGTVGILGSPHKPGLFSRNGEHMMKKNTDMFVESWQVQTTDPQLFYKLRQPQYPLKCLYQVKDVAKFSGRRLKESHKVTMKEANDVCAAHPPGPLKAFCVEDVFQTEDLDFAEEEFYG